TAVARLAAVAAPCPDAPDAEAPHETLRDHPLHRRGDLIAGGADVDESSDRAHRVVGMERGEDEVAGERGLDRDLRRLAVADLADEDDVGILAHDRSQRGAEGETGALVHLDLYDARQSI